MTDEIRHQVLSLSASERALLAHELILSLDGDEGHTYSPEYEAEIERRVQSIIDGTAKSRPAGEAIAEITAKLAK